MFEREIAEIQILSNIAAAQGLSHARDLLRLAASEFRQRSEFLEEIKTEEIHVGFVE